MEGVVRRADPRGERAEAGFVEVLEAVEMPTTVAGGRGGAPVSERGARALPARTQDRGGACGDASHSQAGRWQRFGRCVWAVLEGENTLRRLRRCQLPRPRSIHHDGGRPSH